MNQHGLSYRLNTLITSVAIIIIASVVYLNYHFSNQILISKIEESAINQSNLVISKISRITVGTEEIARNVAYQVPYFRKDDLLKPFLSQVLRTNPILENIHIVLFDKQDKNNAVYSADDWGNQHYFQGKELSAE